MGQDRWKAWYRCDYCDKKYNPETTINTEPNKSRKHDDCNRSSTPYKEVRNLNAICT